jgi:GTP-binding protein
MDAAHAGRHRDHRPAKPAKLIADLDDRRQALADRQGRRGGLGNSHFKSSTNRAPRKNKPWARKAKSANSTWNSRCWPTSACSACPMPAKSTFIRAVSAAKPKVADYPFTTLAPNLGVVRTSETGAASSSPTFPA